MTLRRVPYVEIEGGDALADLHRLIVGLRGRVLNLHRVLANCPPALRAFMVMSKHVRDDSSLSPSLRELAALTVARCLASEYELYQHESIALSVGVTRAQLAEISDWRTSPSFSPIERAVVSFAWEATIDRQASDTAMSELVALLAPAQLVELVLTVGWYHLCHVLIDSLGVEIEARY